MLLTNSDEKRLTIYPVKYNDLYDFWIKIRDVQWVTNEITFNDDNWDDLNDNEKEFIKTVLGFFAASDNIVLDNLAQDFNSKIKLMEANFFYNAQSFQETIHSEVYSLFIDTYIKDESDKMKLFDAVNQTKTIGDKAKWAQKYISDGSFVERLIAFALVEGLFFSASFASIYWLKEKNILPGLVLANEFISRDENLHYQFAVHLYNNYIEDDYKLNSTKLNNIIEEAKELEIEFVKEALKVSFIGLNESLMMEYIEFVCEQIKVDFRLIKENQMKYKHCPLIFMSKIVDSRKTNFFERRITEYTKPESDKIKDDKNNSLDIFNTDF